MLHQVNLLGGLQERPGLIQIVISTLQVILKRVVYLPEEGL